jgi:hypothetical protein
MKEGFMLKKFNITVLFCVVAFGQTSLSFATIQSPVQAQTQPFAPSSVIQLENRTGIYFNITNVEIQLSDANQTEIALQDLGNKTWQAHLSPAQVKTLLGDKKSEKYMGNLIVKSKNDKGIPSLKYEPIEITVGKDAEITISF